MKNKKEGITIVLPEVADEYGVEGELVELTEFLTNEVFDGESQGGGLGGEYGYGVDYENDVFMMHPFCWCFEDDCKWCNGTKPNFLYKPTKAKIWWYKWIGRGQRQKGDLPKDWLEKCIESVKVSKL